MVLTNILVVEDERITAKDIKNSLEKAGYNVPAMVATGEDAIQFTDENRPDLVIMDIKLEGNIDGIDAAETIRSTGSPDPLTDPELRPTLIGMPLSRAASTTCLTWLGL